MMSKILLWRRPRWIVLSLQLTGINVADKKAGEFLAQRISLTIQRGNEDSIIETMPPVTTKVPRDTTLNAYLRYHLALPGTKAMCREGGCGSCIVSVCAYRQTSQKVERFSINSCLVLVFSCHGWEITTIEGIGNRHDGYNEIQRRITAFNGTQCGYCTPGWVMQLYSLLDKNLTMAELERSFGSNTCRCTGYRPILDTIKSFAVDADPELLARVDDIEDIKICGKGVPCRRTCVDCHVSENKNMNMITLDLREKKYFKVYNLNEIFDIFDKYGTNSYMFIDGNTGKGLPGVEGFVYPQILIDIIDVKILKTYEVKENLVLGANIALEDAIQIFREVSQERDEFRYLSTIAEHLELVAHIPVRKIGSMAGNLMVKHDIPNYQSDLFLLFETVGAIMTIKSRRRSYNRRKLAERLCDVLQGNNSKVEERLTMSEFLEYDMEGNIMVSIELPPYDSSYVFRSYKITPRTQNALAIVNAGFLLKINETDVIEEANIIYGNISAEFVHATRTEDYLVGKNIFTNNVLLGAIDVLKEEIQPVDDPPKESPECRKKLALGLFYKFALNIVPINKVPSSYQSGGQLISRPVSRGEQKFQVHPELYPLSKPVQKLEALIQSSGEAQYANDIPPTQKEVFGAFVLSTIHSGTLGEIDSSEALAMEGVITLYTAKDIPGVNSFSRPGYTTQTENEEILVSKYILYNGQPVAIIVAYSEELAVLAATKVKITYLDVKETPPVLTIDQAKTDTKRLRIYESSEKVLRPKTRGENVDKVIKGKYDIHAQYYYFMEPVTCVVTPVDNGVDVYDSTQFPSLTHTVIAQSLGIKESDVRVKVRRIGGGFGGKLTRSMQASCACAIVARKLNVQCRFIMSIQTMLSSLGKRTPTQVEYEVGIDEDGKIQYLNGFLIDDDGSSHSENIMHFYVNGFRNCYNVDSFDLSTGSVLTDLPSNSAMRAPGTNEGMSCIEHIMEHIAYAVKKDPIEVRLRNMRTKDNKIPDLVELIKKETDYDKRVAEIKEFNKNNRWMKKAIRISVMSFSVEYFGYFTALVSIYRGDGTVTVTCGGVEIGQGLNTKVAQVCAFELGIPLEYISVTPVYGYVGPNDYYTANSTTTEICSYAVVKCCDMLNDRLKPIKDKMPTASWPELIVKAAQEEIDLSAKYMAVPDKELQNYYSYGVTVLEGQLDVLTGRHVLVRADIIEDVGLSVNPNVDIGQLEGSYIQSLGYFTTEKLIFDKSTGGLLTNRSLNYHVPLALDIPVDFRVKLQYNTVNRRGTLGGKAVGEMAVCMGNGVSKLLRQCIMESRKDSGHDPYEWIHIDNPKDAESILKALDVKPEEFTYGPEP